MRTAFLLAFVAITFGANILATTIAFGQSIDELVMAQRGIISPENLAFSDNQGIGYEWNNPNFSHPINATIHFRPTISTKSAVGLTLLGLGLGVGGWFAREWGRCIDFGGDFCGDGYLLALAGTGIALGIGGIVLLIISKINDGW